MDLPERKKRDNAASSPPPSARAYPPPASAPAPNGINGNTTGDTAPPEAYYRPYSEAGAPSGPQPQPLNGQPLPGPPPGPPPGASPAQPPSSASQTGPPSMVELPPHPTLSTSGSVVSGGGGKPPGPPGGAAYGGASYGGPATTHYAPYAPAPGSTTHSDAPLTKAGLRAARASAASGLELLATLQWQARQHLEYGPGAASVPNSTAAAVRAQAQQQTAAVLGDLRTVRRAVAEMARAAEARRLRRWLLGSVVAAFVPLVRRLFGRGKREVHFEGERATYTTATEYAFARSRALVDRLRRALHRRGGLAALALFVLGVLWVFSNEVTMRVARTVGRRLRRLAARLEDGADLTAADLKVLGGWRWRVLLWGGDKGLRA